MSLSENDGKQELKDIIKNEDNNLHARTNLFLIVNGILFTAIGVSLRDQNTNFRIVVGIIGLFVSISWFLCTYQSQRVIKALHARFNDKYPRPDGDEYYWVIDEALLTKRLRPAELLGIILPIVFICAWLYLSELLGIILLIVFICAWLYLLFF